MLMPKQPLFSRTIRVCSKTITLDRTEAEVVIIITIKTIIPEEGTSKATTIKAVEEVAHIRVAEVATIKVDISRSLTAINPVIAIVETKTLRLPNARTLTWAPASMVLNAHSLMAIRI